MICLRAAVPSDIPSFLAIYAPYITDTTYSFEYTVPSLSDFAARFAGVTTRFPWIAAVETDAHGGEHIVGYAYAAPMAERMAYIWSADMSIYLDRDFRGHGTGTMLYTELEELLRRCGYYNAYAIITAENEPSRRFHAHMGYAPESHMDHCGYKMGRWLAVDWYVKRLQDGEPTELPKKWDGKMMETWR